MLFNIYINDIVKINNDASFLLYADDTNIFVSGQDPTEIVARTQSVLADVLQCLQLMAYE